MSYKPQFDRKPRVGERVEVRNPKNLNKDLRDDIFGTVVDVDGSYILVELDESKVEVEFYPNELSILEWSE